MVAWLALGISCLTLVVNLVVVVVRWPRVHVLLTIHATVYAEFNLADTSRDIGPGRVDTMMQVVAVNLGSEASSLKDVGLRGTGSAVGICGISAVGLRANGHEVVGEPLPARVEAHGALTWDFQHEHLAIFKDADEVRGYATRYRRWRAWPRSRRTPFKIHLSRAENL